VKPELILKGGLIAYANMGDPNASIPTPQPTLYRPQFAAHGRARFKTSLTFVSQAALELGALNELELQKHLVAVLNTRKITKRDLVWNSSLPKIEVDPETYTVKADGRELRCDPAKILPMAQRYFLF
jgi:urease subunit alpha